MPPKTFLRCPLLRHIPKSAAVAFVLPDLRALSRYEHGVRDLLSLCPKGLSTRHLGRDLGLPLEEIQRHAKGWLEALPEKKRAKDQRPGLVAYAVGSLPDLVWGLKLVGSCPKASKGSDDAVNPNAVKPTQVYALSNGKCAAYGALGFVCRAGPQNVGERRKRQEKKLSLSPPPQGESLLESAAVQRSDRLLEGDTLGVYLDLSTLLWSRSAGVAGATRALLQGTLPSSVWLHSAPRKEKPTRPHPGIRNLDVELWWSSSTTNRLISKASAAPRGTQNRSGDLAVGRLMSQVSIQLQPHELTNWLLELSGPLRGLLKRIRREQGDPTKLLTRHLTGRLILGTHRAGPVVLAETPSPKNASKVLRQVSLIASALQEASPQNSKMAVSGWRIRHVRSQWGEKPLSTLQISPNPVRPGLPLPDRHWRLFHVTWARLGRYIVLTTHKGSIRGLMKRLSVAPPSPPRASPRAAARRKRAQESQREPKQIQAPVHGTLRLDDPYSSLPGEFLEDLDFFIHRLPPWLQRGLPAVRALLDRVFQIQLTGKPGPSGGHLQATLQLLRLSAPRPPGPKAPKGLKIQTHRALLVEALRHRRKNNLQGYLSRLKRLAVAPGSSPYKEKASRILKARTSPDATFGWLARLLSAHLWRQIQLESCQKAEDTARRMETALLEHLESEATEERLSIHKEGWGLEDTGPTPGKRCCLFPARRCPNDEERWRHPTWRKVGVVPSSPGPYQYELSFSSSSQDLLVTLTAVGAPFCDGKRQIYRRIRRVDPRGRPTSPPTTSWKAPNPPKPDHER